MITVSDQDCIDTFLYDVLHAPTLRLNWDKKDVFGNPSDVGLEPLFEPTVEVRESWKQKGLCTPPILCNKLHDSDKDLLEEYVPKLFNTIPDPVNNLGDAIYTLTVLLHNYRDAILEQNLFKDQFDGFANNKRSGQGTKVDIKSFRLSIERIMRLLGGKDQEGDTLQLKISPKAFDLVKLLDHAYQNPDEYFLKNPKYTISKDPISDYLNSLELPDKSNIIKEFMKKIEPDKYSQ